MLVSSLAPMIMPRMALRTLSVLEHVSAYGGEYKIQYYGPDIFSPVFLLLSGVAVFSGFILYVLIQMWIYSLHTQAPDSGTSSQIRYSEDP